jgi:hypothetical protein
MVLQKLVKNAVKPFLRFSVYQPILKSSLGFVDEDFDERASVGDLIS